MITHTYRLLALTTCLLLSGCAAYPEGKDGSALHATTEAPEAPDTNAQLLPGVGPETMKAVAAGTRQAVLVKGRGKNSSQSTVTLHHRTAAGWQAQASWPGHNGFKGWSDQHMLGDLRSPIGVYTLTHAPGRLADPGTRMPYEQSDLYTIDGTGFAGESLAGSFDYVIAIDYNRRPGSSPLDRARPLGEKRGGGIWLHVDHQGPTQGCVSIAEQHMRELLLLLDPAQRPVIVMGDASSLAR